MQPADAQNGRKPRCSEGQPLAFLIAAARPQLAPPAITDFHRALDTLLAGSVDAWNRKDVTQLAPLFAEDAVTVAPGPILAGKRDIALHHRIGLQHGAMGLRAEVVTGAGGRRRLRLGSGAVHGHDAGGGGRPQEHRGNFSALFRRRGDGLLIRVHASNFLPGPAPPQPR